MLNQKRSTIPLKVRLELFKLLALYAKQFRFVIDVDILSIRYTRPLPGCWSDPGILCRLPKFHISHFPIVHVLNAVIRAVTKQIDPESKYMKAKKHRSFVIDVKAPQKTFGWRNKEEILAYGCSSYSSSTRHRTRSITDSNFWKKSVQKSHWNVPWTRNVYHVFSQRNKVLKHSWYVLRHNSMVFGHQNHRKWSPKVNSISVLLKKEKH